MTAGLTLRIGIISPYSLSVPGGVQAQVLGLARELRRQGHEARVLGPCDGPPPEPFVTPLGNSLPTAANGSIAPLAPDASAALRTIRALRDEQFDVIHVHEPLAPGPPMTTLVMGGAPIVGTFHAAGVSTSYRVFKPVLDRLLRRIDVKVVVSKDALELVESHFPQHGDGIRMLFNGVDIATIAAAPPVPASGPTIFFCGRHEQRKGLAVLLEAFAKLPADARLWIGSDGPDSAGPAGPLRRRRADLVARTHRRRREVRPAARRLGVLRPVAARRVVRRRADRGDGRRDARRRQRPRRLPQRRHRRRRRAARRARRCRRALASALARALTDRALGDRLRAAGAARAEDFSMTKLVAEYVAIYARCVDRAAGVSARTSRSRRLISRRAIVILCTSSGPSAMRSVRTWAYIRRAACTA